MLECVQNVPYIESELHHFFQCQWIDIVAFRRNIHVAVTKDFLEARMGTRIGRMLSYKTGRQRADAKQAKGLTADLIRIYFECQKYLADKTFDILLLTDFFLGNIASMYFTKYQAMLTFADSRAVKSNFLVKRTIYEIEMAFGEHALQTIVPLKRFWERMMPALVVKIAGNRFQSESGTTADLLTTGGGGEVKLDYATMRKDIFGRVAGVSFDDNFVYKFADGTKGSWKKSLSLPPSSLSFASLGVTSSCRS